MWEQEKEDFYAASHKNDRFFKVPEKILEEIQNPKPQIQQHAVQFCSKISKLMSLFGLLMWTFNYTLEFLFFHGSTCTGIFCQSFTP